MDNNTQIVTRQDAQLGFTGSVTHLVGAVNVMAEANIREFMATSGEQFGELQIRAMQKIEALRLIGVLDLAGILARYEIIREIRDGNLLAVHPGAYTTLEDMAEQQGISSTELHNVENLGGIVFPWIRENLGGDNAVAELWDELGKSRLLEMVPVLTSSITGLQSSSARVRQAIETAENNAAIALEQELQAVELPANTPAPTFTSLPVAEQRRRRTGALLDTARNARTVRDLRQQLRGSGTTNVQFMRYRIDPNRVVYVAQLDDDQVAMVNRLLADHHNVLDLNISDPGNARVRESFAPIIDMLDRADIQVSNG